MKEKKQIIPHETKDNVKSCLADSSLQKPRAKKNEKNPLTVVTVTDGETPDVNTCPPSQSLQTSPAEIIPQPTPFPEDTAAKDIRDLYDDILATAGFHETVEAMGKTAGDITGANQKVAEIEAMLAHHTDKRDELVEAQKQNVHNFKELLMPFRFRLWRAQLTYDMAKTNKTLARDLPPSLSAYAKQNKLPKSTLYELVNIAKVDYDQQQKQLEARIMKQQGVVVEEEEVESEEEKEAARKRRNGYSDPPKREAKPATEVVINVVDQSKPHLKLDKTGVVYIVRDGKETAVQAVEDFVLAMELIPNYGKHLLNTAVGNLADEDRARWCVRLAECVYAQFSTSNGKKYEFHAARIEGEFDGCAKCGTRINCEKSGHDWYCESHKPKAESVGT